MWKNDTNLSPVEAVVNSRHEKEKKNESNGNCYDFRVINREVADPSQQLKKVKPGKSEVENQTCPQETNTEYSQFPF